MEIIKLNEALEKNVKIFLDENLSWTKNAISCEIKDASRSHKFEATMHGGSKQAAGAFATKWCFGSPR